MASGRYLRRRRHTWFFRFRWPAALAACKVSGELNVSLRTGDHRLAQHRARVLRLGLEMLMSRFTPTTTKTQAEAMVRGWIDRCLWRHEAHCAETGGIALFDLAEIDTMGRQEASELEALFQLADRKHGADEPDRIARALGPTGSGLEAYAGIIDAAGRDMGVAIDRATPDGRLLARTTLRGYATLLAELHEAVAAIPRQVAAMVAQPVLPTFEFFTYWGEFVATKQSDGEWKADSALGAEATLKLFKALIGDLPFNDIDGDIAGRFRRTYQKLPFDHFHAKQWRRMTPEQVITAIEKLSEPAKKKVRTVGNKSANKHIMNLIEYWDYLALNSKIPRGLENPFRGHLTARKQGRAARGEHAMWPADLNQVLFTSPIYSGCKSIFRRGLPGDEIHRDALFWMPLLGRTMGAREDELSRIFARRPARTTVRSKDGRSCAPGKRRCRCRASTRPSACC
jgi:hypothetical protein